MKPLLAFLFLFSFIGGCKTDTAIPTPVETVQPDQDPIAHYTFDGNANDLSKYASNGTILNAILFPDSFGRANSSYFFNAQAYIEIPDNEILDIKTNKLTVSAWIKPLSATGGAYIVQKSNDVNNQGQLTEGGGPFSLDIFPGTARALIYTNDYSPLILTGTTPIKANTWQHLAVTWDGNHAFLYYNGQVEATGVFAKPILVTSGNLYIGAYRWTYTNGAFLGIIDNVRIYNRCLAAEEVQDLYSNYY